MKRTWPTSSRCPSQVAYRYRSPYFKHIFGSDGYASGYYTYLWAEVLDADGFELFKEKGIFDPATAKSFKENVLEAGGSDDPMELYVKFRGKKPTPEALLRNRGLINEPAKPGNLPMPRRKIILQNIIPCNIKERGVNHDTALSLLYSWSKLLLTIVECPL